MFSLVPWLCWSLFIPLLLSFCCVLWDGELPRPPSYPKCCDCFDSLFITLMLKSREPSQIPRWLGDHGRTEGGREPVFVSLSDD